ncbi:hypothetical protein GT002_17285, partial [Streptomyces sp. SID4917]
APAGPAVTAAPPTSTLPPSSSLRSVAGGADEFLADLSVPADGPNVATPNGLPVRPPGRTMAAADRGRPQPETGSESGETRPGRDAGSQFGAFHRARRPADGPAGSGTPATETSTTGTPATGSTSEGRSPSAGGDIPGIPAD